MRTTRREIGTVRSEGGLLPLDLLARITAGDGRLDGLDPEAYHLTKGERINEVVNRSWNRLKAAWIRFREEAAVLPESDPGTRLTRERWLLVVFEELGYGRLPAARGLEIEQKPYAISHHWEHSPIHLVGFRVDLDTRTPGVAGAAKASPHSLVQEFLNRSANHLWGFVANGHLLRILRDNVSLTRKAWVEFDLEAMMEDEVYHDFVVLWLLAHSSRVEGASPEECWLERWVQAARDQGTRVLENLRNGVENAIRFLGAGFLAHPGNHRLLDKLRSGKLGRDDYYRQLLRLVYRLLFIFVAEDRGLLLDPNGDPKARERFHKYYSTRRIRQLAERTRGTVHPDAYRCLKVVMTGLGRDEGCPPLALPPLGSFLWSPEAMPELMDADLKNENFLEAVRALAVTYREKRPRSVDFKNLGAEELGSVYESLLELQPELNGAASFELRTAGGNERKTTGSYYTPESLTQCLLDSALEPVLEEAARKPDPGTTILALKVCDPACGSGHFLIAAAHRIAKRLAAVRTGEEEPPPDALGKAIRDVVGKCLYGVDLNPMAVELCKVSLWLEALEPGKPLSFLERKIICGNSLLGVTPKLLAGGLPDEAFEPIEGDDKKFSTAVKKQNREEKKEQTTFLEVLEALIHGEVGRLRERIQVIDTVDDSTIRGLRKKEELQQLLAQSSPYRNTRFVADAWCAAYVWKKTESGLPPITHEVLTRLSKHPSGVSKEVRSEIERLARQYRFLHWHIAFPDVFRMPVKGEKPENEQAGWSGGFDVVLGNPPWERVKLQEKEWFALRCPEIATVPNAAVRKRLIDALASSDPTLHGEFLEARRQAEGESHFVRKSGRYPLCGRGDVNTYAIFAETKRTLIGPAGRVGAILPSGVATDDTTKFFFQDLVESKELVSLFDFENREGLFPAVDSRMKFCLLTLTGPGRPASRGAEFVFFALRTSDLKEEGRRFTLSAEDIALLNPNTKTCPVFRSKRDAEITKGIYQRVPVLIKERPPEENPWALLIRRVFDMNKPETLSLCTSEEEQGSYRMYESKLMHQFDHRWSTYVGKETRDLNAHEKEDTDFSVLPRFWIPIKEVDERLVGKWSKEWLLGWRDITNTTNERTVIASILPITGTDFTLRIGFPCSDPILAGTAMVANLNSFALDYLARQALGGTHLSDFVIKQLPILSPDRYKDRSLWDRGFAIKDWLLPRVLELIYTAWDLEPFARDCGYAGPPFRWDRERRFLLRAELDAAYFHLYGISRNDTDYILDTFPIVKRNDGGRYGEYRTKRVILECYDAMKRAIDTGKPYRTNLEPPPADPSMTHSPGKPPGPKRGPNTTDSHPRPSGSPRNGRNSGRSAATRQSGPARSRTRRLKKSASRGGATSKRRGGSLSGRSRCT